MLERIYSWESWNWNEVDFDTLLVFMNVLDEIFYTAWWSNPNDIIKWLTHYPQRSLAFQVIPWLDIISILSTNPWKELLRYLSELKWSKIENRNYIVSWFDKLSEWDQRINELMSKIKKVYWLLFINSWVWAKLFWILQNRFMWKFFTENLWLQDEIWAVNDKTVLREFFWEYMVDWIVVDLFDENYKNEILDYYDKISSRWLNKVYIRLSRSVSWLWNQLITSKEDLETYIYWVIETNKHTYKKICVEMYLEAEARFKSPSCQWFITKGWNVHIKSHTFQILDKDNVHQWNIIIDENHFPSLVWWMKRLSQMVADKYNKKYWVIWHFWIDFMLIDVSKADKSLYWIKEIVEFNWKQYWLLITEVNWRITWAFWSSFLYNIYNLKDKYVWNLNTIELSKTLNMKQNEFETIQNKIIMKLEEKWLLFYPHSDKHNCWVFINAIIPWKMQVVIIWKNKTNFEEILRRLKEELREFN